MVTIKRFTAGSVAEMAKQRGAERTGEKTDGVGRQRCKCPSDGIEGREEQAIKDERSSGSVDKEVVPLDDCPDRTRK